MSTGRTLFVIGSAMMSGQAIHWLITPMNHPAAGEIRTAAVVIQALAGVGLAWWAAKRPADPAGSP